MTNSNVVVIGVTLLLLVSHLLVASFEFCTQSQDCKNPLASLCFNSICTCKPGFTLYLDRYCLEPVFNPGYCWLSKQCLTPGSACLNPANGKSLSRVKDKLWKKYVANNYSDIFIPGICGCPSGTRFDHQVSSCLIELLGKPCSTGYDCYQLSDNSECLEKKCVCAQDYIYDEESNECLHVSTRFSRVSGQQSPCTGLACHTSPEDKISQVVIHDSLANVVGFIISMVFLLLLWLGVWNWQKNRTLRHHHPGRSWSLEQVTYSNLLLRSVPSPSLADRGSVLASASANGIFIAGSSVGVNRRQSLSPSLRDEVLLDEPVTILEEDKPPTYDEAVRSLTNSNNEVT